MAQLRKFGSGLAGVLGVGLCVFLSPPAVERRVLSTEGHTHLVLQAGCLAIAFRG